MNLNKVLTSVALSLCCCTAAYADYSFIANDCTTAVSSKRSNNKVNKSDLQVYYRVGEYIRISCPKLNIDSYWSEYTITKNSSKTQLKMALSDDIYVLVMKDKSRIQLTRGNESFTWDLKGPLIKETEIYFVSLQMNIDVSNFALSNDVEDPDAIFKDRYFSSEIASAAATAVGNITVAEGGDVTDASKTAGAATGEGAETTVAAATTDSEHPNRIVYPGGEWYEGELANGIREGKGVYHYSDGSTYEGMWKGGQPNGQGVALWSDQTKYDGEWSDGERDGRGTFTWPSGDYYEGEFKHGKMSGFGTYVSSNGNKYEGQWKDDMKHGEGTFTWSTGERYSGNFFNDNRTGQGTYYWNNGDQYAGDFVRGRREGYGTYLYSTGNRYEGNWKNDKKQGHGTYYWVNGDKYVGTYVNDRRHGQGIYYFHGGGRYEGDVVNDQFEGYGTEYDANGYIFFRGQWKGGQPVQ